MATTVKCFEVTRAARTHMVAQAEASDYEICGFLAGDAFGIGSVVYPVTNIAENPEVAFRMEPQGQYDALVEIEESKQQLTAIYHSHPAGAMSMLSTADVHGARGYIHVVHIVISRTNNAYQLKAYHIARSRAVEIPLIITE